MPQQGKSVIGSSDTVREGMQGRTDGRVGGDVAQVGGHSHNNEAAVALVHRVVGDVDGHLAHCCVMRHLLLCHAQNRTRQKHCLEQEDLGALQTLCLR